MPAPAVPPRRAPRNASPLRQDARSRAKAHKALSASRRAEARYVLDVQAILGAVHRAVLHVVHREHLATPRAPEERHDANDPPHLGLGADLLRRMLRFVKPAAQTAFDRMAGETEKSTARGAALVGIKPRAIPGLAKVIDAARKRNVDLIANASGDFLAQVREVLEENEGAHPEAIAKLLQERVGVSESRGQLIAVDQVLKTNAALSQHRQRAAGIDSYRWSTSRDFRVREGHRELEGTVQSWDDPPETNDDGDTNHPGEDFRCRCVAIPLLAELDDEEAEGAGEAEEPEEFAAAAEE